ncbi:MAG: PAS domain-containing protein [Burkholderiales bacterium]
MIDSLDPLPVGLAVLFAIAGAYAALRVAARGGAWAVLAGSVVGAAAWASCLVAGQAQYGSPPSGELALPVAFALRVALGVAAFLVLRARPHGAMARAVASIAIVAASVTAHLPAPAGVPVLAGMATLAAFAGLTLAAREPPRHGVAALLLGGALVAVAFGGGLPRNATPPGSLPTEAGGDLAIPLALVVMTTLLIAVALFLGDPPAQRVPGARFTLRSRIAFAFLVVTLLVGGLLASALHDQVANAERSALYEAHHIARAIAIAGGPGSVAQPETLRRYLAQLHERDDRTVYAVDRAQRVVASFDTALHGTPAPGAPAATIADVLADGLRRATASAGGAGPPERLLVVPLRAVPTDATSAVTGALVVEYTDLYDVLMAEARASGARLFAIATAVVLLIALLGSRLASAVATPIVELTRSAATLARGDYDVAVEVHGRDEVGTLAAAFNTMARELRAAHAQTRADQDALEARVAERTAAWQAAADAHRRAADELQTIVDHLPLAFVYVDRDLVARHHNEQFARWIAADPAAIDGRHGRELLGPENLARVEAYIERVLRGEQVSYERPNVTRDGREQVVAVTLVPRRGEDGSVAGFYAMVQDVTERERASAALRQGNEHLSEVNRRLREAQDQLLQVEKMASIGQLASGVAHEINNPIGYVYSNLGTLDKYFAGLLDLLERYAAAEAHVADPDTREDLARAKQAADIDFVRRDLPALLAESREGITRVRKIVQDLRNFSRTASDEAWQPADLVAGIESTLNIVWNELKYKAEVVRAYSPLPPVECRPSQLNQVFMNLLVNAAQSIRERGTIRITTGVEGEMAWVEVADTGEGIRPEHLSRVFDPFFTTKAVGHGTGLGLSLSYRIVDEHHGRIEVTSEVGAGSRFRVWLPIRQPAPAAPGV